MPNKSQHESVDHSKFEWSRGDVHTNTLEGFFRSSSAAWSASISTWTRSTLTGTWPNSISAMNTREKVGINDVQRSELALQGFKGKRLTYETTHSQAEPQ